MSALRTLLQLGGNETALTLRTIYVYHTSMDTTRNSNPGCCCLWTASADVKWAAFETWGAGGDGGGGCCCMAGFPGGSGSYGRKIEQALDFQKKGGEIKIISEEHWLKFF